MNEHGNKHSLPSKLPRCEYPTASSVSEHGLLTLPETLPQVDYSSLKEYRSEIFRPVTIDITDEATVLELARMVARSFILNEPMNRHIQPPNQIPDFLTGTHVDPFGNDSFGTWTADNIVYWFIRLIILTNPASPFHRITLNTDALQLSFMIEKDHTPIGGAFNVPLLPSEDVYRENDPFLNAIFIYMDPIINKILHQEHEAIDALMNTYPSFKHAYKKCKVGMHFMIARSPDLPSEHTFELFAASAEQFGAQGYEYMLVTASNQWTGAACELLNGIRVHYAPFRKTKEVADEQTSKPYEPYSSDGYISDKDSGLMFYVIKL